ncbi:hypothetical protein BGW36DRAFT_429127 [Talaromyces proteolyticus]|uniref:DEAD/DEAH box helicase n=1 Tax=Talaromyces proteolyticus TaxID=1131652 RepID=A0AAD4PUM0_9EURO|nr:uncharacterized protein BGW36DRAFT_429127 [Talaromyces proteolyticus]KAH8695246.1 hypothetical protein BGW36DRAFT_429127 [Talaromyces proteolyticus]
MTSDILNWYQTLQSRTVDLVGDYAGNDLFIIDGNSILIDVLSNTKLDLWPGFQLLHATYLVEKFLHKLYRRKCNFHVVFFENQATVCIPDGCPRERRLRYLCARKLIMEHLRQNLMTVPIPDGNTVKVHVFESYHASDFQSYLTTVGAYFIMSHDGAGPQSAENSTVKVVLRQMINWFIWKGYNVALVNNLQCRDTKVMAVVLEGFASNAMTASEDALPRTPKNFDDDAIITVILQKIPEALHFTQRDMLIISSICYMLMTGTTSVSEYRAILLQAVLLRKYRIRDRVTEKAEDSNANEFLSKFFETMLCILECPSWEQKLKQTEARCDLGDCIDGRLFYHLLRTTSDACSLDYFEDSVKSDVEQLISIVQGISGIEMRNDSCKLNIVQGAQNHQVVGSQGSPIKATVLPFRHPVFDTHLQSIHLNVDASFERESESKLRIFRELTHWHNHKNKLQPRAPQSVPEHIIKRNQRRNHHFLADMMVYAASMTNTAGGILEPETIHVSSGTARKIQKAKTAETHHIVAAAAATVAKKQTRKNEASMRAMVTTISDIDSYPSLERRYWKLNQHLASLTSEKRCAVEAELKIYLVHILMQIWIKCCQEYTKNESMHIPAIIWDTLGQLVRIEHNATSTISECVNKVIKAIGLPKVTVHANGTAKLAFEFVDTSIPGLNIEIAPAMFQLIHAGPYMDRSIGSAPDSRVLDFHPDEWQRKVLDQIDAKKSLFVVAPTSAGKTFISFYAMKQVLQEDDDSVLVYVAPTKALVNQIAAEIQARFSKTFKYAGKCVWAIHTRDYRINNPTSCQILVTVPHILQIMLLSPSNAKTWSPRVKRIIFDEVHCIGQSDDGVVWEQLLLLAPCPIIALSATVGNPEEFKNWLELAQQANGHELTMIKHPHRYSDLRKFVYHPPDSFSFNELPSTSAQIKPLGLDDHPDMAFIHPVASLIDRSRGMPDDLTLESRDCVMLWEAMRKHQTPEFPLAESNGPPNVDIICKVHVIKWQEKLKIVLKTWMEDHDSPFDAVLLELRKFPASTKRPLSEMSPKGESIRETSAVNEKRLQDTTLPLLCSLHERDALPAILFNYDRSVCEGLASHVVKELEDAEIKWKQNSKPWTVKLDNWEKWKTDEEKRAKSSPKTPKRSGHHEQGMTKDDLRREVATSEASPYASFNPESPIDGFHFANFKKLTDMEFQKYAMDLKYREVPQKFIDALKRGIGIHHAGMNRKYRQICEILFRKGYLRVVIATGTLALGINMPCKTVVFSGDSVFLTALSFRQAAGRAGRRGFDVLGNVVFQGVPYSKVCRLLSSRLPDLNGHFPITTSLVLRLMILVAEAGQGSYGKSAIDSLLSSSRMCLGGEESKHTILHHLRFSIEYLRRNNLLSSEGRPLNFAGCISHLYYTENSSFAFHALLSNGYFHSLCKDIRDNPEDVLLEMMLVMSHLFGRYYVPSAVLESYEVAAKKSPSIVVLPPLPEPAAKVLRHHNQKTLDIYAAYVSTFIDQHVEEEDCILPFTNMKFGGDVPAKILNTKLATRTPVRVNSSFVALSGHRDGQWKSISELCDMVRSGVWLEESVVPYVGVYPDEGNGPLNAYLYDFFKHGNKTELIRANKVRQGDVWFVLNDFSLVLASIVTSLANLLNISPDEPEMDALQGVGEAHEQAVEDAILSKDESAIAAVQQHNQPSSQAKATSIVSKRTKNSEQKIRDSWDDEESEEDDASATQTESQDDTQGFSSLDEFDHNSNAYLLDVFRAFTMLKSRFDEQFKAIWS